MNIGDGDEGLSYYAVAVARRDNPSVNFNTLKGKVACFPGEFLSVSFPNISLLRVSDGYMMDSELANVSCYSLRIYLYAYNVSDQFLISDHESWCKSIK